MCHEYLRDHDNRFFSEHDGWRCAEPVDTTERSEVVAERRLPSEIRQELARQLRNQVGHDFRALPVELTRLPDVLIDRSPVCELEV